MSAEIIDPEAIANLRALDPDGGDTFLREIVTIFLEDTPQRIAELKAARASGDLARLGRAAHSIKGSASNLGAEPLRALAERLELANKLGNPIGDEDLARLDDHFAAAAEALRRLVPAPDV